MGIFRPARPTVWLYRSIPLSRFVAFLGLTTSHLNLDIMWEGCSTCNLFSF